MLAFCILQAKQDLGIASLAESHGANSTRQLLLIQLLLTVGIEEIEHLLDHIQLPAGSTK